MVSLRNPEQGSSSPTPGTVFTSPMSGGGKSVMEKRIKYIHAKNMRSAYSFLIISVLALTVYGVYFFYPNLNAYLKAPAEIAGMEEEIEEYEKVVLPGLEKTRDLHQSAYEQEYEEVIQALDKVFPVGINKRSIVSTFENFADKVNLLHPPFSFNSITLGKPVQGPSYVVTPVSLTIRSSTVGFEKFLDLVNFSGYLHQEEKVRLMSVSNIRIRYNGVDENTGEDNGVNFSVQLNIYSRPA